MTCAWVCNRAELVVCALCVSRAVVPVVAMDCREPHLAAHAFPLAPSALVVCSLRIICFHSAGNAQDMFTSEGTGTRRAPSPLLVRPDSPHDQQDRVSTAQLLCDTAYEKLLYMQQLTVEPCMSSEDPSI